MVKEIWKVFAKKADFNGLGEKYHMSPVVARIIRNRDMISDDDFNQYLNGTIKDINSPFLFKDMDKAVEILYESIRNGEKIRIIGDYDVDGICSTYILYQSVLNAGGNVTMDIPDRIADGYGIKKSLIDRAKENDVSLIITCDNGIAAIDEILYAKEIGMKVVVTDHHQVPFEEIDGEKIYKRVNADATINPKQPDCSYPFKEMCGAGIAYRYMVALREYCEKLGDEKAKILKICEHEMIEIAGIATVCDMVSLTNENRIIAKKSLEYICETENVGLKALLEASGLYGKNISSYHYGFVIGPSLNATGRLETAKMGFELLCEKDEIKAMKLATKMVEINDTRKRLTEEGAKKAIELAYEMQRDRVLVIYVPGIHESIAGIVASRVKEKFNKPTIILTDGEEFIKGSARSIDEYNMFEGINECGELLKFYGGHPMAAGLSLEKENVDIFRKKINENCKLTEDDLTRKVWIDVPMPIGYISKELIDDLKLIEPYGKDNNKPVFAIKDATIKKISIIGANKNVAKILIEHEGTQMNAMLFSGLDDFMDDISKKYGDDVASNARMGMKLDIKGAFIYSPSINEFRGNVELQIIIEKYKLS